MKKTSIQALTSNVSVIPVIVIEQPDQAIPIAEALLNAGLNALEVTLRTPHGLQAISAIKKARPEAIVGAGTVLSPELARASVEAGADFIVTPGTTPALLNELRNLAIPCLPGASSVSEMMMLKEQGFNALKFFPAAASGGIAMLKSVAGPLPSLSFCPTGGIGADTAAEYLALNNVFCVGGSWMLPADMVSRSDWEGIYQLAKNAAR